MIRFNIIGTGFLDLQEGSGIAFKTENQQFRFADISLGRSIEFTVPATDYNRQMLGFAEDPAETGEMVRRSHPCQMVYDGGAMLGTLEIHGYENKAFKCLFLMNNATWINDLQNKKLADCPQFWTKGVLWASNGTVYTADDPALDNLQEGNAIVAYENGMNVQTNQWQLVPSVNLKRYIEDLLTTLGVTRTVNIPKNFWLVSASLNGGQPDSVTLIANDNDDATVTQSEGYLSTVDDYVYASRNVFFGIYAVTTNTCRWYKAEQNIKITFDANFPQYAIMAGWVERSTHPQYAGYGGRFYADIFGGWYGEPLAGRTIEVSKGSMFQFFQPNQNYEFGFTTVYPHKISAIIERNGDLEIGEVWQIRNNQPDMTVFEFLKSACVATGYELLVTADGVTIKQGEYGGKTFKVCDNVVSVDSVTRCVDCWGNNTNDAKVVFDSDEYVKEHIEMDYTIDNENLTDAKSFKAGFSEGSVGTAGVLIEDWQSGSGGSYKLKAKKWTIAYADPNKKLLQRVAEPDFVGYADIANQTTCVKMKMRKPEATFFDLKVTDVWLWRGMGYVWTDAQWSNGVLTMTLQKVSQDFAVQSV